MSTSLPEDTENVFDLNEAVPETELLDNSIQKGRAQLSVKTRRHRPSRSRLRDSMSSTEGDESLDRKSLDSPMHSMRSPLHSALRGSSPSPDSLLPSSPAPRTAFTFDTSLVRRNLDENETPPPAPRGRYRQLTNTTSQEALGSSPTSSPSKSCPSTDSSPIYIRRARRPESEVLVTDDSRDTSPAEPGSPTVIFDKKTKRRFLDLGVTLRRSYGKVRKEKTNRFSMGSREPSESPSRSSGSPFVPFSWFTDSARGSASSSSTPSCSPRTASQSCSPRKSNSQPILTLLAWQPGEGAWPSFAYHSSGIGMQGSHPPLALPAIHRPAPPLTGPLPHAVTVVTSQPQESTLSEEFSPRSPRTSSGSAAESRSTHPYQTLSQSSDEPLDEPLCLVSGWSTQQVCQWLKGLNMEQYIPEFTARDIDGEQLLQMDGTKLKGLGVSSSSDRSALKRRLKDMHAAAEKERKALDKLERQKEKQRRKDQEQHRS